MNGSARRRPRFSPTSIFAAAFSVLLVIGGLVHLEVADDSVRRARYLGATLPEMVAAADSAIRWRLSLLVFAVVVEGALALSLLGRIADALERRGGEDESA